MYRNQQSLIKVDINECKKKLIALPFLSNLGLLSKHTLTGHDRRTFLFVSLQDSCAAM